MFRQKINYSWFVNTKLVCIASANKWITKYYHKFHHTWIHGFMFQIDIDRFDDKGGSHSIKSQGLFQVKNNTHTYIRSICIFYLQRIAFDDAKCSTSNKGTHIDIWLYKKTKTKLLELNSINGLLVKLLSDDVLSPLYYT